MNLKEFFDENRKIALAFSGGVDSAFLMYSAKKYAADFRAYYVKSQFQPQFELDDAVRLAKELDVPITIIDADILSCSEVVKNPQNRCYYCKIEIFNTIMTKASEDGFDKIMDGTNASDEYDDRPGMKALAQLKVLSPLRECGITKAQVRSMSHEAGLFTWNKPSYACLATRIPAGTVIDAEKLCMIENAEDELFKMGFTDFRVRWLDGAAKIQLPEDQMQNALILRAKINDALKDDFSDVLLDLKER